MDGNISMVGDVRLTALMYDLRASSFAHMERVKV